MKAAPLDPHWEYVYSISREFLDDWERTLRTATDELRASVSRDVTATAVELGQPKTLLTSMADGEQAYAARLAEWQTPLTAVFGRAGKAELGRLGFKLRFDLQNPFALRWITQHAAELVTAVTAETKAAIRAVVLQGFVDGVPPKRFAAQIKSMIGLTERDAKAVLRYWETLNQDRNALRANEMADTYADKLLRLRSENIARTETIAAAANGTQQSWRQAQANGLIAPESKRVWIAASESGRTCPLCMALDGVQVGLEEPFPGGYMTPPRHPSCRCAIGLLAEVD